MHGRCDKVCQSHQSIVKGLFILILPSVRSMIFVCISRNICSNKLYCSHYYCNISNDCRIQLNQDAEDPCTVQIPLLASLLACCHAPALVPICANIMRQAHHCFCMPLHFCHTATYFMQYFMWIPLLKMCCHARLHLSPCMKLCNLCHVLICNTGLYKPIS